MQKHIVLTGHIVDHLTTIVAKGTWAKLSEEDRRVFTAVAQEAAMRATAIIQSRERELVDTFKQRGLTVTEVDKEEFKAAVLKAVTFESLGYRRADYDKIQALKPGQGS